MPDQDNNELQSTIDELKEQIAALEQELARQNGDDGEQPDEAAKQGAFSVTRVKDVDRGTDLTVSLTLSGAVEAGTIGAVVRYDPEAVTVNEVVAGKQLSASDATVLINFKKTPGAVRLTAIAGDEPFTEGTVISMKLTTSKSFSEPVYITPEISEFTDKRGVSIPFTVQEGFIAPSAEASAEPITEPEPQPEPDPDTGYHTRPTRPDTSAHENGNSRPTRPNTSTNESENSRPSRPDASTHEPDNSRPSRPNNHEKPDESAQEHGHGRDTGRRPDQDQTTSGSRPSGTRTPDERAEGNIVSLSSVKDAELGRTISTTLSCSGGAAVQTLTVRVVYNSLLLKYNTFRKDALFRAYPDLTVTAAQDGKDAVVVTVSAPTGMDFKASGKILNLLFDVRKTDEKPSELSLSVVRFGFSVRGRFRQVDCTEVSGTVSFKHLPIDPTKPGPATVNPDVTVPNSIKQSYVPDTPVELTSAIGCCVNLLGNEEGYLYSAKLLSLPVINFTGLSGPTSSSQIGEQYFFSCTEKKASKLAQKFSANVSINVAVGLFKCSVGASYEQAAKISTERVYSKLWYEYVAKKELISDWDTWKSRLDPKFWAALNDPNVLPETLFKKYGTHIILSALYGGYLDMNAVSEKRIEDTSSKIQSSMEASYGWKAEEAARKAGTPQTILESIFKTAGEAGLTSLSLSDLAALFGGGEKSKEPKVNSVGAKVETAYEYSSTNDASELRITGHAVGGAAEVPPTFDKFPEVASKWVKDIKEPASWRFIGASKNETDALYPVWELLEKDSERYRQIKNYYSDRVANVQNALDDYDKYVTDVRLVWSNNENDAMAKGDRLRQQGWIFDKHNLNHKVGGAGYLYMCCKAETIDQMKRSGARPITNFFLYCDDKDHKYMAYDRFDEWKKTVKNDASDVLLDGVPLKDLEFSYLGDNWSLGSTSLDTGSLIGPLNFGKIATGRFVLLCLTRDTRFRPITSLCAYYDKDEYASVHTSGEWNDIPLLGRVSPNVRCSTNAGHHDCEDVFIAFRRSDEFIDLGGSGRGGSRR